MHRIRRIQDLRDKEVFAVGLGGVLEGGFAIGMIATHDLALTEIVETLGAQAANAHFTSMVEDGQLTYDYTMRPGVITASNAVALMRSLGISVPE